MTLLSIGDEVREGTYWLHSRFHRAINFTDGRRLVTLVTPDIGAGPVNIVFANLPTQLHTNRPRARESGSPSPRPRPSPQLLAWPQPLSSPRAPASHRPPAWPHPLDQPGLGITAHESPIGSPLRSTPDTCEFSPPPTRSRSSLAGPTLHIGRYSILLANRRWSLTQAQSYRSLLHIEEEVRRPVFRRNLRTLERFLIAEAHAKSLAFLLDEQRTEVFRTGFEKAFARRIREGVEKLFHPGATRATAAFGTKLLAGCGFGLTPSGDDFIAGVLIALNVLQTLTGRDFTGTINNVCKAAEGENLLSNAFLVLARDGRLTEKTQELVSALLSRGATQVRSAARTMLAVGETSGADWMTGFVVTARNGVHRLWPEHPMRPCCCQPSRQPAGRCRRPCRARC